MKTTTQSARGTTRGKTTLASKTLQGKASKSSNSMTVRTDRVSRSAPLLGQRGPEIQPYGHRFAVPLGIPNKVCEASIAALNQVLADTMVLRDLYKKHHWQVSGATFYQLHLLLDKHFEEQSTLIDTIAERIQSLGGISVAMAHDVAEMTRIERPPRGREEVPVQLSRLLEAHEVILKEVRQAAHQAADQNDDGTNDLLVSQVIRTHELQAWFLSEHLVNLPTVNVRSVENDI